MKKLRQPTSLKCFACGRENPFGLKMEWFNNYDENRIEADFTLSDNYCSYPGVVHGGIVATILDETAGRAVLLSNDFNRLMVTLKLEVVYKKVTPTNTPLKAIGRVIKNGTGRAQVEGEILLPDGSVSAKCSALLYKMPQEVMDNWGSEAEEWARTTPKVEEEIASEKE
ncbi:MAG: PaaI family thioesterase [Elusimicrobiaceae bacterium]|nr:PaaI family thioesterase [Elusimicrobiaceae bacterium]